jgi:hypothetical protein
MSKFMIAMSKRFVLEAIESNDTEPALRSLCDRVFGYKRCIEGDLSTLITPRNVTAKEYAAFEAATSKHSITDAQVREQMIAAGI